MKTHHLLLLFALIFSMNAYAQTDNIPPLAKCRDIILELDISGQSAIAPSDINMGSSDNVTSASNLGLSLDLATFDCDALGKMPSWQHVGPNGISAGATQFSDLAVGPDGIPYIAYQDRANNDKLTVLKWNGSSWDALGGVGISGGTIQYPSMAVAPDGTPYVAYIDLANSIKITVLKWTGSSWSAVGGPGISGGAGRFPSLAIAPDGTPYVAFRDGSVSNKTTVLKWTGSSWTALGGTGISTGKSHYQALAIAPDGTPYVAYQNVDAPAKATVLKWTGSSWLALGGGNISAGRAEELDIVIGPDGTPYVAYEDFTTGAPMSILRWTGSSWEKMGGANFASEAIYRPRLAITKVGTIYLAYRRLSDGSKTAVRKWNGTHWVLTGGKAADGNSANSQSIDLAPDGTPYVGFTMFSNGKAAVIKWDGDNFSTLRVTDAAGNSSACRGWIDVVLPAVPVAHCQNITVNLDETAVATLAASEVDNGSIHACSTGSLAIDRDRFTCANLGAQLVILTVSDASGNTGSCQARVWIEGQISPALEEVGCNGCGEIRHTSCQNEYTAGLEAFVMNNAAFEVGASLKWFADDKGSKGALLNNPPSVNPAQVGTHYYWVEQQLGDCPGPAIRLRSKVKRLFTPDFNLPAIGCGGTGQIDLAAWVTDPKNKATAYTFYDVDPGTNPGASPIGTASATKGVVNFGQYVLVTLSNGPQTFWVQSTVPNGCGGIASSTLNAPPQIASLDPINNVTVHAGDLVNLTFTGHHSTYILWFNTNNPNIGIMGSFGAGGLSFTASNATSAALSATIQVIPYNGNCAGSPSQFTITVNPGNQNRESKNRLLLAAGKVNVHNVKIDWDIQTSQHLLRFELEKKRNDGEYSAISHLNWNGNGNYSYTDRSGMSNANSYRLKMVFQDGRIEWSEEVEVKMAYFDNSGFLAFPNPTSGRIHIKLVTPFTNPLQWQLSDIHGKLISSGEMNAQQMNIDLSAYPASIYFLTFISEEGKRYLQKIIKR